MEHIKVEFYMLLCMTEEHDLALWRKV